ncbi:hypothetical protein CORC01_06656 [Colletotrichum orchidophilum]|uniref:Uncharacterized protein n=1 Tax=Colletotrichum orchidophilum TaxID=1209926 RepID=A0A1G4B997_9PEZI|nr:uncharacterized protein CORC01_06656 [Colletotrichum orchidophilum]OHE97987.1 hypothetical protein CORC01_06656 [Colletotrichum orchidophilum]
MTHLPRITGRSQAPNLAKDKVPRIAHSFPYAREYRISGQGSGASPKRDFTFSTVPESVRPKTPDFEGSLSIAWTATHALRHHGCGFTTLHREHSELALAPSVPYPSRRSGHWRDSGDRGLVRCRASGPDPIVTASGPYSPPAVPASVSVSSATLAP